MRILLLRVTHAPHVLAITLFERTRQYITDRRLEKSHTLSGTESPLPNRKPQLKDHLRSPRPLSAANLRYDPMEDEPQPSQATAARERGSRRDGTGSQAEMEAMLNQLASQVQELKAMLARQGSEE